PRHGPPHPPTLVAPRVNRGAPRSPGPTLVAPRVNRGAPRSPGPTLVAPRVNRGAPRSPGPTLVAPRQSRDASRSRVGHHRATGGAGAGLSIRSHQSAAPSRRVSAPGAWTSCSASGKPAADTPDGSEIDGAPSVDHGWQSEASPVQPRPAGAGAGAVGDSSASCCATSGATSSRTRARVRLAATYSVPRRLSPRASISAMPDP